MSGTRPGGYCTLCGHEIASFDGLRACPACGSTAVPCSWADQVDISVNWHELRILVMWAEMWARTGGMEVGHRRLVGRIARTLRAQHPDRSPLTLAGEVGDLAKEYRVETTDPKLRQDVAEQEGREITYRPPQRTEGEDDG